MLLWVFRDGEWPKNHFFVTCYTRMSVTDCASSLVCLVSAYLASHYGVTSLGSPESYRKQTEQNISVQLVSSSGRVTNNALVNLNTTRHLLIQFIYHQYQYIHIYLYIFMPSETLIISTTIRIAIII